MNVPARTRIEDFYTPEYYRACVKRLHEQFSAERTYGDPVDPLLFLAESLRISGDEAVEAARAESQLFKAHRTVTEAILGSVSQSLMHPIIINTEICGHRHPQYRRGIIGEIGNMPPPSKVQFMLQNWVRHVEMSISTIREQEVFEREMFAWQMHDDFYCILPFVEGNRRTASLVVQDIRRLVNLPHMIVRSSVAHEHDERVDVYRRVYFIPWMRNHAYS